MKALFVLFLLAGVLAACGVKSRPLPPLTAPQIGRGEPTLSAPSAQESKSKSQKKQTVQDDFDDDTDF